MFVALTSRHSEIQSVTNEQLLAVIAFAMVMNVILIAIALFRLRRSRWRGGGDVDRGHPYTSDLVPAMATAAGGYGALRSGPTDDAEPMRIAGEASTSGATASEEPDPVPADGPPGLDAVEVEAVEVEAVGPAFDPTDPAIGLESPAAWRRAVEHEAIRLARYHRPATVMFIELDGYDRLVERLGEAAGQRVVVATGETVRAQSRSADRCAQVGRGRFAILLPETDEISAINFAERIRDECDRWLEAGEVAMRVAIGWSLLDAGGGASVAIQEAERRMDGERRHRASAGTTA